MAIEVVDLPINSMVIFHSYVSLPEGMLFNLWLVDLEDHTLWQGGNVGNDCRKSRFAGNIDMLEHEYNYF